MQISLCLVGLDLLILTPCACYVVFIKLMIYRCDRSRIAIGLGTDPGGMAECIPLQPPKYLQNYDSC